MRRMYLQFNSELGKDSIFSLKDEPGGERSAPRR
jgi:hypothetical protein